jgi:hypothetical protein
MATCSALRRSRSVSRVAFLGAAWRFIDQGITTMQITKETWFAAEVHRAAGEIALLSPELDANKAEAYFERALAVSRPQQAKNSAPQ